MSGPQTGQKRGADSEDGRSNKRLQSGEQTVEPFPLVNEVRDASLSQIFGAATGLSARRYDQDLLHVWKTINVGDATFKQMHEAWFQCRKHSLVDQLWTLRYPPDHEVRKSDKKAMLKTIVTFEKVLAIAETNGQEDIVHAVSIVLLDYIMVMVLFYTEKNSMEEAHRIFPKHRERFAELSQRVKAKLPTEAVSQPSRPVQTSTSTTNTASIPEDASRPAQPSASTSKTASIPEDTRALIDSMRVPTKPGPGLGEIVGFDRAKKIITKAASGHIRRPNSNRYRGLLLHGPPGTGKTTMARSAANSVGYSALFMVLSSSLMNQYVGNSEKNIAALFQIAQESAPAIIFFDEIDKLFAVGDKPESESSQRVASVLLVKMSLSYEGVTVIAATNRPWLISSAVLRRFDVKYHVALPSTEEVTQILRLKIQSLSYHLLTEEQIQQLGRDMAGFTGDDVQRVVRIAWNNTEDRLDESSPSHFRNVEFQGQTIAVACLPHDTGASVFHGSSLDLQPGPITLEDMEAAIEEVKPDARDSGSDEARHAAWAKDRKSI
ncbi:hypothetical protein G7Y79_00072g097490 [Physcia stellaris]|nr:hypothetical protein G7Y79_00072g097490 [Physcia stellaris]